MKASISNRIYMNCDAGSDLDKYLMRELTYEISQQPVSPYPLVIKNMIRISPTVISIPSGRSDLIPKDYIIIDKRVQENVKIPEPKFVPREDQQKCIDTITDNGLVNCKVGWGKTIAGLGLAHKMQMKTLIVTTTTTIRDMWVAEIKKWFGFTPGIIGGGKFETDAPICVGNIQTIRNKAQQISDLFGVVIVDEVHRTPAACFTKTLDTFKARYKIGLSGTLIRKDGMHCVLEDYFGFQKFVGVVENTLEPVVHMWDTGKELNSNEFIPWSNIITKITEDPIYRTNIVNMVDAYVKAGHKVLILSDRTDFLEYGHSATEDYSLLVTGKVTGKEREDVLETMGDLSSPAKALWATQSIFSEGVSVNALSCVIPTTPINNEPLLEQIIGRVMRQLEGKIEPCIAVDLGFGGNTGKRHRNNRTSFYVNKGWKILQKGKI